MQDILLMPPVAFAIIFVISIAFFYISSKFSYKDDKTISEGKTKAYACGEDYDCHRVQPDYTQFFPFAFFFTIMHVLTLIVSTVPAHAIKYSAVIAVYIMGAIAGLFILFRN
jgi:NADH-quinone oxidoreductase subunit A